MSAGNAFQHLGDATENADSAYTVIVIGLMEHHIRANTTRSIVSAYSNNIREIYGWLDRWLDALCKGDGTCKLAGTLTIQANA